ncbi:hypothetical protein [Catenulispora rubra]|uniref:hypothetical protein n=1 Tax=Catenulispora rubra TaxID=280293 RepID=UPI0018923A64|nr:hypothetical protein [Catenulispora rubra]
MDAALRDRIGLLCDQLSRWPVLRTTITDAGAYAELTDLLSILTGPDQPDPARVQALLESIEEAGNAVGVVGLTTRMMGLDAGLILPGGLSADPGAMVVGWVCPLGRCDRVVLPAEGVKTPMCAAGPDKPMTPRRTPTR